MGCVPGYFSHVRKENFVASLGFSLVSKFAVVVVAVQKLISFNRSHLFTSAFISIALENYLRNHCYNFC